MGHQTKEQTARAAELISIKAAAFRELRERLKSATPPRPDAKPPATLETRLSKRAPCSVCAKRGANCRCGRPMKMSPERVEKLMEAYLFDATHEEAAAYAGVSRSAVLNYLKEFPDIADDIERLKKTPSMLAKMNIVRFIEGGHLETSKWYLERRSKEFSPKQEATVEVHHGVIVLPELTAPEIIDTTSESSKP